MTVNDPRAPRWAALGAFLSCFLIAGIPFWLIPYSQLNVPDAFFGVGVAAVFIVAALLPVVFRFSFRRSVTVPGAAFPAALMVRVVVEGVMEPSRHNLWPLALMIAIVLGVLVAGAGALLGTIVARALR